MKKDTKNDFIKKAIEVHGGKYDYSKVDYINSLTKVCIVCPEHGEFYQLPASHLRGVGCPICGHKSLTDEEFVIEAKKIHGDKYDYSKIYLKDKDSKRCIICPKHGEFWQKKSAHLKRKRGCPICGGCEPLTTYEFIRRARLKHGDKYDYSKVEYKSAHDKVCIICPEHGEFWQEPDNHYRWGCKQCATSSLENEIENLLLENQIAYVKQKTFEWLKYKGELKLDFFLPDYSIAIECQGEQHYAKYRFEMDETRLNLRKTRDQIKQKLCEENNIRLIYFCEENVAKKYNNAAITDLEKLKQIIYGRN